ncbi:MULTISPECIES: hypothetical protein [unclassified Providencia]|uniref:hypothetical protein n=1 Tax=unclassified Providencia TaxID=2633465 RepID=UPI002349A567|nr:hypothetical protein [Providencia sp. PROV131]
MDDLIDLIRVVCKAAESKKAQFHDEIKKRGWRGLRADSTLKVLGMLNGEDDGVKKYATELYAKISNTKDPIGSYRRRVRSLHLKFSDKDKGVNVYLLNSVFWSSVNFQLAMNFYERNAPFQHKVVVVECLMQSLEVLSESFGLGVYSYFSEELNRLNRQRSEAAKKGIRTRSDGYAKIRQKACELLHELQPKPLKWKNKNVAAEGISEDLWKYIELVKNKYPNIEIGYADLVKKIANWPKYYDSVKAAMEETAITKKRSKKNAKKRSK